MEKKKSWREKLSNDKGLPKLVEIPEKISRQWGTGMMLIPSPIEVDEFMKKIPEGKLITLTELRQVLAKKHSAAIACPMTTGIFVIIAANAAAEEEQEGKIEITPYWRTLKSGGQLNPKYPGSVDEHKRRLELEGYKIIEKGKKIIVENYQDFLLKE